MRIGFLGQSGPYAPIALRHLFAHQGAFEMVLVVEGLKGGKSGRLHRLYPPNPGEMPVGENLRDIGRAGGTPVLQTRDVNAGAAIDIVKDHRLDMIVCVGFDRLFSASLLATAARGGINAHPSALPKLRGPSPVFWALHQGRRDLAVTLHALDRREDHGSIYTQESFIMPARASGAEIFQVAGALAGPLLVALIEEANRGLLRGVPQDHSAATRAPRPKPEDALVEPTDWECDRLVNFACGAPFSRSAWMRLGDETFHIRRGIEAEPGRFMPAQYLLQRARLIVQCKDGVAHLEIQA